MFSAGYKAYQRLLTLTKLSLQLSEPLYLGVALGTVRSLAELMAAAIFAGVLDVVWFTLAPRMVRSGKILLCGWKNV